ncbi:zinc ribbon domain-containing protein [Sphingobium yanoikuyae]|jgi:putative transposase
MIRYKAEKAGGKVVVVDPRHITQTCNACGSPTSESNDADRHICACGADVPRGTNNAINILARGLSAHAAALGRRVGKVLPNASV